MLGEVTRDPASDYLPNDRGPADFAPGRRPVNAFARYAPCRLLPDQDENPGDQREDREQDPGTHSSQTDDADHNQVNREQEHADVFGEVHGASWRTARSDARLISRSKFGRPNRIANLLLQRNRK